MRFIPIIIKTNIIDPLPYPSITMYNDIKEIIIEFLFSIFILKAAYIAKIRFKKLVTPLALFLSLIMYSSVYPRGYLPYVKYKYTKILII